MLEVITDDESLSKYITFKMSNQRLSTVDLATAMTFRNNNYHSLPPLFTLPMDEVHKIECINSILNSSTIEEESQLNCDSTPHLHVHVHTCT